MQPAAQSGVLPEVLQGFLRESENIHGTHESDDGTYTDTKTKIQNLSAFGKKKKEFSSDGEQTRCGFPLVRPAHSVQYVGQCKRLRCCPRTESVLRGSVRLQLLCHRRQTMRPTLQSEAQPTCMPDSGFNIDCTT